jgi:DNA-binding beta-propeller fold protein YncE
MIVPNALADTAGILIFDTASGRLLKEVPVGFEPLAVGVTPDGKKAYLCNGLDRHAECPRSSLGGLAAVRGWGGGATLAACRHV